jgi:hypothetical protein
MEGKRNSCTANLRLIKSTNKIEGDDGLKRSTVFYKKEKYAQGINQ